VKEAEDSSVNVKRIPGRASRATIPFAFFSGVALLGAIAAYAAMENRAARDARSWVAHTFDVLNRTLELENAVLLMESRHRAYLVGGNPEFIRTSEAGHDAALGIAARLEPQVADNPAQGARLREVRDELEARHGLIVATAALAQREGLDAARADFHALGSGPIDPIRNALRALREAEIELLASRRGIADERTARLERVLLYGTALALLLMLLAGWALRRQVRQIQAIGENLQRTSALQKAMLDAGGQMIISVRTDGVIQLFNRAASDALGYRPEEMIGRQTPMVFHDAAEIDAHALQLSVELGEPVAGFDAFTARPLRGVVDRAEWTYVRKDGSRFPVELAVTAVRATDGELLGFIGMASDLTVRKTADAAIQSLNLELEARAESLAVANRELEGFSYSVSHDLRAPLRHIEGYAAMLEEDAGPSLAPEWRRYLDRIGHSARRMGALIDDLLSFSRLARAPLQRRLVDMRALVQDVLDELAPAPGTIALGDLPNVAGDASLLRQVWVNLLSNAIKYSAPRGEFARIGIQGAVSDGSAQFQVIDNGVGFDMRYRDKLFGVFQRLHAQDAFEGTGVGLAIVDRIVRRHGGTVDASSEPGMGASFQFELPVKENRDE
jgi:PAS domain S-box-containing protein